jgi:hypothetical protein
VGEPDEELGEDVLLGEATLAKLNVTRKPVESEEVPAVEEDKKVEKAETKSKTTGRKVKEEVIESATEVETSEGGE